MNYAANRLLNRVRQQALLVDGDRVLVAVSGGPDSVALLHVLHALCGEFALHLEVAHLQHGIRGEEAKADAYFARGLAEKLGLVFHLKEIDLPELRSRSGKGNLEALARVERYRFFDEVVRARKLDKIATAHTQDDQAETMLMWLLRGAGRSGLGGMNPAQVLSLDGSDLGLQVVRPFLEISKAEILEYLGKWQIQYRLDSTNGDTRLLRNWIRLELLPQLRERIDNRLGARLARQAAMLRDEQLVLDQFGFSELEVCRHGDGLDRVRLMQEPVALQRLILRNWIEARCGSLRGFEYAHIEALRELASTGPANGRLAIPGGWELQREYDALRLVKGERGFKPNGYLYSLKLGETLRVCEAKVELISNLVPSSVSGLAMDLSEAYFDADALPEPLVVRNFRRGDRFEPLGMSGRKKVKDLFIDRKVALTERANLPMLIGGGQVLWIPGHGRSRAALVTSSSRAIARIKAVPLGT